MRFTATIFPLLLASTLEALASNTNDLANAIEALARNTNVVISSIFRGDGIDTNNMLVFQAERRPGGVIFVDECLTRGLTNSMTVTEIRGWVTNIIMKYNRLPDFRTSSLASNDIPKVLRELQTCIPACKFSYNVATNIYMFYGPDKSPPRIDFIRGSSGGIEAVSVSWYEYGVDIGPEYFMPKEKAWYDRKLADGIYLWHGYK